MFHWSNSVPWLSSTSVRNEYFLIKKSKVSKSVLPLSFVYGGSCTPVHFLLPEVVWGRYQNIFFFISRWGKGLREARWISQCQMACFWQYWDYKGLSPLPPALPVSLGFPSPGWVMLIVLMTLYFKCFKGHLSILSCFLVCSALWPHLRPLRWPLPLPIVGFFEPFWPTVLCTLTTLLGVQLLDLSLDSHSF
jgi:hypothetical protein